MIGSNDIDRSKKFYDALVQSWIVRWSTVLGPFATTPKAIEDPPGVRPNGAYLAYLRDPDGHKVVAVAR
jgi:hypothetical protein